MSRKSDPGFEIQGSIGALKRWLMEHAGAEFENELTSTTRHGDHGFRSDCKICAVRYTLFVLEGATNDLEDVTGSGKAARRLIDFREAINREVAAFKNAQPVSHAFMNGKVRSLGEGGEPAFTETIQQIEALGDVLVKLLAEITDERLDAWLLGVFGHLAPSYQKRRPKQTLLKDISTSLHEAGFSYSEIAKLIDDGGGKSAAQRVRDRMPARSAAKERKRRRARE